MDKDIERAFLDTICEGAGLPALRPEDPARGGGRLRSRARACASWRPRRSSTSSRPRTATSTRPLRFTEDVVQLRLALAKVAAEGGEGAPAFRERFAEDYARFDEELKLFRQTLGDDIIDWLDSRWGCAAEGGLREEEDRRCSSTTKRSGPSSTTRGCGSATLYPITEKSLAGGSSRSQPFVDHLARKRDQDKKKITS